MDKALKDPYTKLDELWRAIMAAAATEDLTKVFRSAYAIKAIRAQIERDELPVIEV